MKSTPILLALLTLGCAAPTPTAGPLDEVGVPIYPGAKLVEKNKSAPAQNGSHRITATFSTPDPAQKVVEYYNQNMQVMTAMPTRNFTQIVGKGPNGLMVQIYVQQMQPDTRFTVYAIEKGAGQ